MSSKKHLSMKRHAIAKYIDHTFAEACCRNEDFLQAVSHLVCIRNYTTIECPGDYVEGTRRCLIYFLHHYVCTVDEDRCDTSKREVEEFEGLTDEELVALHKHIVCHTHFAEAETWYRELY